MERRPTSAGSAKNQTRRINRGQPATNRDNVNRANANQGKKKRSAAGKPRTNWDRAEEASVGQPRSIGRRDKAGKVSTDRGNARRSTPKKSNTGETFTKRRSAGRSDGAEGAPPWAVESDTRRTGQRGKPVGREPRERVGRSEKPRSAGPIRINRYLAQCGFGSRRAVEQLVADGRVSINGQRCTDLAARISPGDVVEVGKRRAVPEPLRYLAFHKPRGVICSRSDERARRTIYDVLPAEFSKLDYIGRLDKDSEGLLLLSNDGDFAERLAHPRHEVEKEYVVTLDRAPESSAYDKLLRGTMIDGVRAKAVRAFARGGAQAGVVLTQGVKRQVRVMFSRLGYEVKSLKRVRIGPVTIARMAPGAVRPLTRWELEALGAGGRRPVRQERSGRTNQ